MRRTCIILFAVAVASTGLFAHDGKPHKPADLLNTWSFDPLIIGCLAVSGLAYLAGSIRLWRASGVGSGISRWAAAAFWTGWVSMIIALVSPLHPWGEVLFSAHMTQHEILMLVSAPLFVLGRPFIAFLWSLPLKWRLAARDFLKTEWIQKPWRVISAGLMAWLIHAIALWTWHIPALFQATLTSNAVHTLQHASFFLTALLFWWVIITAKRGAAVYGAGVLYLFTTSIHSGLLGAFLTFTGTVWYPAYSASTASWGLTPIEDQQLGGLIMWVPAGLIYILAGLIMFASWLRETEKRVTNVENAAFSITEK